MIKKAFILSAAALLTLGILCFQSKPAHSPQVTQAAQPDVTPDLTSTDSNFKTLDETLCGISLQLHNGPINGVDKILDEISKTNANTVCLVIHAYQENASSNSIFIDARKIPSDADLKTVISHAKKRSLRVMIMPVILLSKRRGGEWRGEIKPASWDEWWNDYSSFIIHYAKIAQQTNVDIFAVGSELITTETQTHRWRKLISAIRGQFSGLLTYSANWDHYEVPQFWKWLDMVGMTTYYDLARGEKPTSENMLKVWSEIKKKILKWQKSINKPIIFTEVGWPNQTTAAEYPWNYYKAPDQPAPQLQADCFKAFFKTWCDTPQVAGVLVWEWRYHPSVETHPQKDTSYCPAGKPAMKVINEYFLKMENSKPLANAKKIIPRSN